MKRQLLLAIALTALLATGCGTADTVQRETEKEWENAEPGASQEESISEERALSPEELRRFTNFVNDRENNGFLLSQYAGPKEADLEQVLYDGAGMENAPLTEEERSAYLKEGNMIETDITNLSGTQIDAFLQKKLGITLTESQNGLDWFHFADNDCYLFQHGDTNWAQFVCTGGTKTGEGLFVLHCKSVDGSASDCMLTLQKAGEDYRFVFNYFEENSDDVRWIRKIEEQSFSVELNGWGEVEFVSYAPDQYGNPAADVTFELQRDGKTVYVFPGVEEDNIRFNRKFDSVDAVTFQDYDGDGYEDIIIICTYDLPTGIDTENTAPKQEARIYKAVEEGFWYAESLSNRVNLGSEELSIAKIMERIKVDSEAVAGLAENVQRQLEIFADKRDVWLIRDYPEYGSYAVYDLNGDGKLELLTEVVMGTGLFAENHFYQINETGDGIAEIPQDYYVGNADGGAEEFEIAWAKEYQKAFLEEGTGIIYYLASDVTRNGAAEHYISEGAWFLENGRVQNVCYRRTHDVFSEEDESTITYYDADCNEIDEQSWEQAYEDFISGKTEITCTISWKGLYPDEASIASKQEILAMLAESYREGRGN